MSKLTLGFSPCPNDTFIFDALVHSKVDTEGLAFEVHLADVEELNDLAFKNKLDITKLSYHALAYCSSKYQLLTSGSALGSGVGPLLIAKKPLTAQELSSAKIAIPGVYTTANFLLSLAYPLAKNKTAVLFSEIEQMVLNDEVDAGLIIHENRFTYAEKGLQKIIDLGEFWEKQSGNLIPLGGIVVKRSFDDELKQKINRVLKKSVEYAFEYPTASQTYVAAHSQEMSAVVTQQHINLYVNEYSIDLGKNGKNAVEVLFAKAIENGLIKEITQPIFVV